MIVFCILVSLPLAFMAWRTYGALDREALAQMRFFAEQLLDEIEAELGDLVQREENRAVDEYSHLIVQAGTKLPSPLAGLPQENFILGYFQNNPDGTFQTPLLEDVQETPENENLHERVGQLRSINAIFNQRKFVARTPEPEPKEIKPAAKAAPSFAERFLRTTEGKKSKSMLGREKARVEEISPDQAMNLAKKENPAYRRPWQYEEEADDNFDATSASSAYRAASPQNAESEVLSEQRQAAAGSGGKIDGSRFQAEVAPLQAVAIDPERVFIFRRVGIDGQIYRQGFVLQIQPFLDYLMNRFYAPQPISEYTHLILSAAGTSSVGAKGIHEMDRVAGRTFPAPFGFLTARMVAVDLPASPARRTFTLALAVLGFVMATGLVAIYRSARAVLDLSERRSQFVSAVTHELKTPLTNIRMYIEMLDQGIAATPEQEQEYFGILVSESARLSGLIQNVLELSRLEKQTRRFDLRKGDLSDVLDEVRAIMAEGLARERFELIVPAGDLPVCTYDREVLVQILINLMENSIKFGRHMPQKKITIRADVTDETLILQVSDTGPGIPRRAIKQVFDDFYRVDNDLNRTTGGTGIGLALVKKFTAAMGGRVKAENNAGPGCTITIVLPVGAED
jgi:signal transduction histidine kinase